MTSEVIKSGVTLAAMAAVCTWLVAATFQMTAERIEATSGHGRPDVGDDAIDQCND